MEKFIGVKKKWNKKVYTKFELANGKILTPILESRKIERKKDEHERKNERKKAIQNLNYLMEKSSPQYWSQEKMKEKKNENERKKWKKKVHIYKIWTSKWENSHPNIGVEKNCGHERFEAVGHGVPQLNVMAEVWAVRVQEVLVEVEALCQHRQVLVLD